MTSTTGLLLHDLELWWNSAPGLVLFHLSALLLSAAVLVLLLLRRRNTDVARPLIAVGLVFAFHLAGGYFDRVILESSAAQSGADGALVDRALSFLLVVIVGWSLLFPRRAGRVEIAYFIIALLAAGAGIVATLLIHPGYRQVPFNRNPVSLVWDGLRSLFLVLCLGVCLFRRPKGWGLSVAFFLVLFSGNAMQLWMADAATQLPGLSRLFDFLGLPLAALQWAMGAGNGGEEAATPARGSRPAAANATAHLAELFQADNDADFLSALTAWMCGVLQAEVSILVSPAEEERNLVFLAGHDRVRPANLAGFVVPQDQAVQLYQAAVAHIPLRLGARGADGELNVFAQAAGWTQSGPVLYAPLGDSGEQLGGVLLLAPYSGTEWTEADGTALAAMARACTGAMRFIISRAALRQTLEGLRGELDKSVRDFDTLRAEKLDLETRARQAEDALHSERQRADDLAVQASSQTGLQEKQNSLQSRITELEDQLAQAATRERDLTAESGKLRDEVNRQKEALTGTSILHEEARQLRDNLEATRQELATWKQQSSARIAETEESNRLRASLVDAENRFQEETGRLKSEIERRAVEYDHLQTAMLQAAGEKAAEQRLPGADLQVMGSIVSELRQPMSSAVGYTDLLLSESAGILGALQRKFLERIRAGISRMEALLDDLLQLTLLSDAAAATRMQPVDFTSIVDAALTSSSEAIRERNLVVRMDISDSLPPAEMDRDALQQIINHLIHNAVLATPPEKEIAITAHAPGSERERQSALLFTIQDGGAGISPEDQPRVFTRLYRAEGPLIEGLGDTGVGMAVARTLTEALGGRIWLESQLGRGTVFFVLLPWQSARLPEAPAEEGAGF